MPITTALLAAALALSPPRRAAEFASTLGVNVHIEYTDGTYRDLAHVMACLDYIGVHAVRDAAPNPSNQGQGGYIALAKAGIKFDLFVNGEPIAPAVQRIARLRRDVPGSVISIEGINEVNNHGGYSYAGEHDVHRAGAAFQAALYDQVKATPALNGVPVVAFTDYPYTAGRSDVGNIHVYPDGDSATGTALAADVREMSAQVPGQPIVITEFGYATSKGRPGVSELAQARLLLVGILQAAASGVERTYVYELLDAYADPAGSDQQRHLGVFNLDFSPKLAARMLHLIKGAYADSGASARTFPLRGAALSWVGGGPDLRSLVVQKSDGEIVAAFWRNAKLYDFAKQNDIPLAPEPIDLRLPDKHGDVAILDPIAAKRGSVRPGAPVTRLLLGANPLIVQITPGMSRTT